MSNQKHQEARGRRPPRSCIFCGGTPLTNEHVLPAWIGSALVGGSGKLIHAWTNPETGDTREWRTDLVDFKAKVVCGPCNNGWMNDLETAARPYLIGMIQGRGRTLHDDGRRLCAYWALKTVMMLECAQPEHARSVRSADFAELFEAETVLPDVRVWIGATSFGPGAWSRARTIHYDLAHGREEGYSATLAVGHLVFEVMRIGTGSWTGMVIKAPLNRALLPLWPRDEPVVWPPPARLDRRQVALLGLMLEHVGVHVTRKAA